MSYLFVPFAQAEGNGNLVGMANNWIANVGQDVRGKPLPTLAVYDGGMTRPLSGAGANESIYVLAHGAGDPVYVANNHGNTGVTNLMSATELAKRINRAGLPLGHRKLKLYICNLNGTARPFAERVHQVLAGKFTQLQVMYYLAAVSIPLPSENGEYHKLSTVRAMPDENTGFILVNVFGGRASDVQVSV
jgi:hypothetical protein